LYLNQVFDYVFTANTAMLPYETAQKWETSTILNGMNRFLPHQWTPSLSLLLDLRLDGGQQKDTCVGLCWWLSEQLLQHSWRPSV